MNKTAAALLVLGTMIGVAGCGSGGTAVSAGSDLTAGQPVSAESLRSAPTGISLGGTTLTLNAVLFRNYMPTVSINGTPATHPMSASLTVSGSNGASIPSGLTVTAAWVVQGDAVGALSNLSPAISTTIRATSLLTIPNSSTNWAPGSTTEVVVQLQSANGQTYLLQTPSVPVSAAA